MHKVILINAASSRTEHEFATINEACGSCGPKMPVIFDGRAGQFEFVSTTSTDARFVETDHVFQFFAYAHLPAHLQEISRRFYNAAEWVVLNLPHNPERTKALDALLVAKDAAVRARVAK